MYKYNIFILVLILYLADTFDMYNNWPIAVRWRKERWEKSKLGVKDTRIPGTKIASFRSSSPFPILHTRTRRRRSRSSTRMLIWCAPMLLVPSILLFCSIVVCVGRWIGARAPWSLLDHLTVHIPACVWTRSWNAGVALEHGPLLSQQFSPIPMLVSSADWTRNSYCAS